MYYAIWAPDHTKMQSLIQTTKVPLYYAVHSHQYKYVQCELNPEKQYKIKSGF